jgi:hypothetical protein
MFVTILHRDTKRTKGKAIAPDTPSKSTTSMLRSTANISEIES